MSAQADSLRALIDRQIKAHGEDDHMVKLLQRQPAEMQVAPEPDEEDTQTYFTRVVMKTKKAVNPTYILHN
jgi:hypothetical protein